MNKIKANKRIDEFKQLRLFVEQNLAYTDFVTELINSIDDQEKTQGLDSVSAICRILLLYILERYNLVNTKKSKYKSIDLGSNQNFTQLFSIAKRFNSDPYGDFYNHINFFLKSSSPEIQELAHTLLLVYERNQAAYLSKLYITMKLSTLKKYLGSQSSNDTYLINYIDKYGWSLENETVKLIPLGDKINLDQMKEDLNFVNKMTVSLENIAKSNSHLQPANL